MEKTGIVSAQAFFNFTACRLHGIPVHFSRTRVLLSELRLFLSVYHTKAIATVTFVGDYFFWVAHSNDVKTMADPIGSPC